ncbi:cytochrome P450 [Biscogniauxia marginata]|nr:cytochrome P450 [Biscogniauxia marginata]
MGYVSLIGDNISYILGVLIGVFAHRSAFIHGEWHTCAPEILVSHTAIFVLLLGAKGYYHGTDIGHFVDSLVVVGYFYIASLLTSIVIHRVFFHPLTKEGFQGPWLARVTKLWHVWKARKGKNHYLMAEIHEKYGDFVRTGPAEITVFRPEAFMAIDGPRTECVKGEFYDLLWPSMGLILARNKRIHSARRRDWKRGFTAKALNEYAPKILNHIDELDRCIEADARSENPSKMHDLLYWFGFDVMGEFVLNKPFYMLRDQKWHTIVTRLQRALFMLGPFSCAAWILQVGTRVAPRIGIVRDWHDMIDWCRDQMRVRLEEGYGKQPTQDLTHYLMEEGSLKTHEERLSWLSGDSLLGIVAGSGPTAGALIFALCNLVNHPQHIEILHEELTGVDVTDQKELSRLVHLNAIINETLRLSPPLLTGGARKTTGSGTTIAGTYIPPNTTIFAPLYIIFRREDCYERATEFVPERWSTRPDMIRNPNAFAVFGTGHHSCLGRAFALHIMRYVLAKLVKKYRFRLAPGDNGKLAYDEMIDQFTTKAGSLSLCFELRE